MPDLPGILDAPVAAVAASPGTASPAAHTTTTQAAQPPAPVIEQFMSSDSVPPELQERHKQMQAAFTQRMQGLAEKSKGMETMQERANLLDALLARPDIQALVAGRNAAVAAAPEPEQPTMTADDMAEMLTHPEKLIQLIDQRAEERAKRLIGPVAQKAEQVMTDRSIETFKASHPDMEPYRTKMADLLEAGEAGNLESAYRLAKYDSIVRETQQQTRTEMAANAAARTESASSSAAHVARPSKKMSWDESAAAALQAVGAGR